MGSNPTQAIAISLFLIGFVLLAGASAGGGIILVLGGIVLIAASCGLFLKAKPWENQGQ